MLRALLAIALLAVLPAHAQEWPTKPIRMIVPFPPGGGTDTVARPLAAKLAQILGQQVVIDNRGGAGGTIGAAAAAKAPPDGYTVLLYSVHGAVAAAAYKTLPYDLQKDLVPVTTAAIFPDVLVAANRVPAKTLPELIEALGSAAGQIRAGTIRPIVVTSAKRSPAFPEIPTAIESGLAGFEITSWYGLWVPAGTPPTVMRKLHDAVVKAFADPELKDMWAKLGAEPGGSSPEAFRALIDADVAKWGKVVREAKITLD